LATPTRDVVDRLPVLTFGTHARLLCQPAGTDDVGVGCNVGAGNVGHVEDEPMYISDGSVYAPAIHAVSDELQPHVPLQLTAQRMALHVSVVGAAVGTARVGADVVVVPLVASVKRLSGIEQIYPLVSPHAASSSRSELSTGSCSARHC